MTAHRSAQPGYSATPRPPRVRTWALAGVVGILAATWGGAALPARATERTGEAEYACWADLGTGLSLCVDEGVDLVAAVALEYGVSLAVPDGVIPGSTRSSARIAAGAAEAATLSTVISVIYDNTSYGGGSYALSINSGCGWGYASLGALGWNDRASSYRSFNGCTTALFANENYSGASTGYATNAASLGGMNDQGSSWSVH